MIFHLSYVIIPIVLFLGLNSVCDEVFPKSSLAFVIDITLSMGPVIDTVKAKVNAIFDTVKNSPESPIANFVLVLFADPNVYAALVTTDSVKFKNTLESITLEDGGLCPELAMAGIKTAIDSSLRGSYIYVFTDASAYDFDKFEEVKRAAQEKECQVSFVLNSKCLGQTAFSEDYVVYTKLAEATSGQVFHLHVDKLNEILEYVAHSIKSHRVPVFSKKFLPGEHELEVKSDSKIKDLTIAITAADMTSSAYIAASITGPDEETIDDDAIVRMGEILILKVSESTPGMYKVEFSCKVPSYVIVTARSDVKFRHGFSLKLVSSLDDTVFNPFSAHKNYLFIKLFGENVILTSVKLLDLNYHMLLDLPLTLQNDKQKLYVTELFDSPSSKFRIAVKGLDTETNTNLTRFGSVVLETENFEDKTPVVKIKGDSKLTLNFNSKVQLNCSVEAYPEPIIVWKDLEDRKEVPSMLSRAPPYIFFRILDVHLVKNKTYECYAENKLGKDSKMLQVEVKPKPFIQIQEPESQILYYGAKGVLQCKVKSFPPAKIFWLFDKQKASLVTHGDVVLSPDNSTLTIKSMNLRTRGRYGCLIEYQDTYRVKYATVALSLRKPKFESPLFLQMSIRDGEDTKLTCRLLEGDPQPHIKWYRKLTRDPSAKFKELPLNRNQTSFIIKNANIFDTRIYKCTAWNPVGFNIRVISLSVECKPSVVMDTKEKIVQNDTKINLKCSVQGLPPPEVTWYKNGTPLRGDGADNINVFKDNSLRIYSNLHHTGTYTCNAKNKLGSAASSVNVTVYFLEVTPPLDTKYIKEPRMTVFIRCRDYVKGVPKPTLKWLFFKYDTTLPPKKLRTTRKEKIIVTGDYLQIRNVQRKHRGNYMCVATNIGQSKNITFEVDVLFAPKITNNRTPYQAVVGDRLLKILCNATGNPEPTITWYKNGFTVATVDNKILFDKLWLVIQHVEISDNGSYICEAKNTFRGTSSSTGIIKVVVDEFPLPESIKATTTMLVANGSNTLIRCALPHSKFDALRWYKDRRIFCKGKLELKDAKLSDSGVYTCRVNKLDSLIIETGNTNVIVGLAPTFVNKPTSKVEVYIKEDVYLDCQVPAKIESTVNWWHNGNKIPYSEMLHSFKMDEIYVGEFKCEATNKFGTVQRTFDLVVREFTECVLQIDSSVKNLPVMITISGAWPKFKTTERFTTIPKLKSVKLSCSTLFTTFEETDLIATCFGGTKFLIENKVTDFAEIKCKEDIKPTYIEPKRDGKKIPCNGEHTTIAKLAFSSEHKAINALEYCLDEEYNPIYAKYIMRLPADYIPNNMTMWDDTNLDKYSCDNQKTRFSTFSIDLSKCCFASRYLVNPKDMFPGQLQRATYNRLNIVPHWSTCHSENWDAVEENVRRLAQEVDNNLIIYTGTAGILKLNNRLGRKKALTFKKQYVATYLWKVVQNPATQSSIAIVQLNIPEVRLSDVNIRCTDICHHLPWMGGTNWRHIKKGYTYCCELRDFIDKFYFSAIPFEPYFNLLKS